MRNRSGMKSDGVPKSRPSQLRPIQLRRPSSCALNPWAASSQESEKRIAFSFLPGLPANFRVKMLRATLVRRLPYPNHAPPNLFPPLPAVPPSALPQVDAPTKLQKGLQLTGFVLAVGQSCRITSLCHMLRRCDRIDFLFGTALRFWREGSLLRSRQSVVSHPSAFPDNAVPCKGPQVFRRSIFRILHALQQRPTTPPRDRHDCPPFYQVADSLL